MVEPVFSLKTLLRFLGLIPTSEASVFNIVFFGKVINKVILYFMYLGIDMISVIQINALLLMSATSPVINDKSSCYLMSKKRTF